MSYVVQSCCSIRVQNQLLKIVSDASTAWYGKCMQRGDNADLTKKGRNFVTFFNTSEWKASIVLKWRQDRRHDNVTSSFFKAQHPFHVMSDFLILIKLHAQSCWWNVSAHQAAAVRNPAQASPCKAQWSSNRMRSLSKQSVIEVFPSLRKTPGSL